MLQVGTQAPDFTLPNEQETIVSLSSFRGSHAVVLIFYPGDNTPICTKQLCGIRDTYDAFTDAGAVVFGINPANESSHQTFAQKQHLQFHLLVDKDKSVAKEYKALLVDLGPLAIVNRTVYVIDKNGTIVFAERGTPDTNTILAALKNHPQ